MKTKKYQKLRSKYGNGKKKHLKNWRKYQRKNVLNILKQKPKSLSIS